MKEHIDIIASKSLENKRYWDLAFDEKLKSKIINDFDKQLQTEFSTDLYDFIATVKLDSDGDSFHENVDVIYEKYGPQRLREFLDETIQMLKDFQEENAKEYLWTI